jgi:hypothetical protein
MRWDEFVARMAGVAVLAAAAPGCAQPQKQAMNAVPIAYLAHLATIPVSVNGTGPYRFVVDTGAGIHVLNETLVEKRILALNGQPVKALSDSERVAGRCVALRCACSWSERGRRGS